MTDLAADPAGPAEPSTGSGRSRWDAVQPWLTLACRVGLAAVLIAAAVSKYPPALSVQAVEAYQLFPYEVAELIGYTLPLFELALAVLLLAGLATRYAGAAASLLMVVFLIGIFSAMARGLSIDCGCFGAGGEVDPEETTYGISIAKDLLFAAMGAFIAVWPRSALAIDRVAGLFR